MVDSFEPNDEDKEIAETIAFKLKFKNLSDLEMDPNLELKDVYNSMALGRLSLYTTGSIMTHQASEITL